MKAASIWLLHTAVVVAFRSTSRLQPAQRPRPTRANPDEYYDALSDVEEASARLEAARKRLALAARSGPRPQPRGARSILDRSDAGTLLLTVPAAGVTGGALMGGVFSAAWFSAIIPATASMLASGAILGTAFLAPFWMAGGMVLKTTLLDPAKSTTLSIGEFAWELRQELPGGVRVSEDRGSTEELAGADVAVSVITNGVPSYVCRLVAGATAWGVGDGLSREELEWIASEINDQLSSYEKNRETEGKTPLLPPM
mmetsp:Transcript_9540/g.28519  ORF Transcript_9540/g.28519 Transcript_9540/m.28519 type:complete len:256 (-) Transcript_9540:26-793(-)